MIEFLGKNSNHKNRFLRYMRAYAELPDACWTKLKSLYDEIPFNPDDILEIDENYFKKKYGEVFNSQTQKL